MTARLAFHCPRICATMDESPLFGKDIMGIRGELYTTQVTLENRSYFFNVKENRMGDVFLQIVESKKGDGADFDRHQIAIFADDMQSVLRGLEDSLRFIEKDRKARARAAVERRAAKEAKSDAKMIYRRKGDDAPVQTESPVKKTGRVHIVSKRADGKKGEE